MKDPQTLMLPVMLPTMLPLFMLGPMLRQPEGTLTKAVSYFPPATPMMMVGRQAMSATIQWWEPIVGALLVLATTLFCVWGAGRIFRVGLLMQGKTPKLGQMLLWVFKS
jgi:ABC-2 type transport system permease protein